MRYALRAGLSFCRDGDRFVFLDVPADRYFMLPEAKAESFARLVDRRSLARDDEANLQALLGRVLVQTGGCALRTTVPPPNASRSLLDEPGRAALHRTVCAWLGFSYARFQVRHLGLAALLRRLQRLKNAAAPARSDAMPVLEQAVAAFARAGRLVSINDRCLAHSAAIAVWLVRRRVAATLVIGVAVDPFQAHCWVQVDDLLVNERVDVARDYIPILVA